ncbi:hypothetical protein ACQ7CX_22640, partial [Chryseobacterium arthrosphaerae]|uniref:hypothetical protein n=1 Tax=Chryseobacterium arthrosphaerae TaxID=651561 RepID=UPI003D3472FB
TQKLSPPAPMVLLTRESRPPPVFILFLKILYHNDKGFFLFYIQRSSHRTSLFLMEFILFDENGLEPVPIEYFVA